MLYMVKSIIEFELKWNITLEWHSLS